MVRAQPQAEDGFPAAAVKPVEQARQGQGRKGKGHGPGRVPVLQAEQEHRHGRRRDERALDQDARHERAVQDGRLRIARRVSEQAAAGGLHADGDGGQAVGQQVDKQQMHGRKGRGQAAERGKKHGQNAGHVAREQEMDGVLDVGVHAAAALGRADDGGEVVVSQDHRGGVLADRRARHAHRHADVGLLERGRVVDAVAGHGDNLAPALPGRDNTDLVRRRDPGIDRDIRQRRVQRLRIHRVQLRPGHGAVSRSENAELPGDGGRRNLVVARDHDGADAAARGVRDGRDSLGPGRVDHGGQADKGIVRLVRGRQRPRSVQRAEGKSQNAQALFRQRGVLVQDGGAVLFGQRAHALRGQDAVGPGQQDVERALGQEHRAVREHVQRAHQFAVGVERELGQARMVRAVGARVDPQPAADAHQRDLGRVANLFVPVGRRVRGQDAGLDEAQVHRVVQVERVGRKAHAVRVELLHGHAVLGQGAGLIRADDRHAAQRLDRLEVLDNGVLPSHLLGADGQDDGDDRAERLRDGRDGQGHGKHHGVQNAHAAAENRQAKDQHADGQDDRGQPFGELIQADLQGCPALLGRVHERRDPAELGVHTRARHDRLRAAVGHERA